MLKVFNSADGPAVLLIILKSINASFYVVIVYKVLCVELKVQHCPTKHDRIKCHSLETVSEIICCLSNCLIFDLTLNDARLFRLYLALYCISVYISTSLLSCTWPCVLELRKTALFLPLWHILQNILQFIWKIQHNLIWRCMVFTAQG